MNEQETKEFVIGCRERIGSSGILKYKEESFYFSPESLRSFFRKLEPYDSRIKRIEIVSEPTKALIKKTVDQEFFGNYCLLRLILEGTMPEDFSLEIENKVREEEETKYVGPHERVFYSYHRWVEVHVTIKGDKSGELEEIVRSSVVPAEFYSKYDNDCGVCEKIVKRRHLGADQANEKVEEKIV